MPENSGRHISLSPFPSLPSPNSLQTAQPLVPTPNAMRSSSAASRRRRRSKPALPAPRHVWVPRKRDAPPAATCDLGSAPRHHLAPPNPSPPETQPVVPPASPFTIITAATGSHRGRHPSHSRGNSEAAETRDWASLLPLDAISAVFRRLDHIEILMGPGQVCRSWRHAARDDPALWRRIDMRGHADLEYQVNLYGMAKVAIRRAQGQCEAFWAEYAADDGVLQFLGDQAPSLKSLCLISCQDIIEFEEEVKKFPLLEELEISLFTNIGDQHVFQEVGKACPELKHFRFNTYRFCNLKDDDDTVDSEFRFHKDDEALGIASMHGLHTLQLFAHNFTNKGLTAILDNCPHLESLDIRHCFNVIVDDDLLAKCARIKTLRLPCDSTDDYQFQVVSPLWSLGIESDFESDSDDCVYGGPDYILDSDEYDDYCDPFRYLNGV